MRRRSPGWTAPARTSRRRPPFRILLLFVLLPFVGGLFVAPAAPSARADDLGRAQAQKAALDKKIAKQKAEVLRLNELTKGLKTEIAATSIQLTGINADLKAMRAKVATMQGKIAVVQAAYNDLVFQVGQLDQQTDRIVEQENQKAQELATRKAQLAQRVRSAYDANRTSMLETFLSGDSFTDILTEVGYFLDIGEQDKELAQQVAQDQLTLASLHQTAVDARSATDDLRVQTAAQKVELDKQLASLRVAEKELKDLEAATKKALDAQRNAYRALSKNKAALKKALAASRAAQQELQDKINKLVAEQYQHGNIPSSFNGTLKWPMVGNITQDFGCTGFPWEPPLGSCAHFHQGIDIVAPYGTVVRSSGDGVVIYCGWNYADGADPAWIVIVAHSESLETWYAHLVPGCPARAGTQVKAGTVVGHEGNTGHSTGAHLHWAVRYNGEFVNPRLFV